jgi:hypothetical protein
MPYSFESRGGVVGSHPSPLIQTSPDFSGGTFPAIPPFLSRQSTALRSTFPVSRALGLLTATAAFYRKKKYCAAR